MMVLVGVVLQLHQLLDCELSQLLVFMNQADGAQRQKPFDWWRRQADAANEKA